MTLLVLIDVNTVLAPLVGRVGMVVVLVRLNLVQFYARALIRNYKSGMVYMIIRSIPPELFSFFSCHNLIRANKYNPLINEHTYTFKYSVPCVTLTFQACTTILRD